MPFDPNPLDGLLFYNKKVNYLPGSTPLVGWLKGYMVPELLNIEVSKELMSQRPNSYANMGNYIKEYDEERKNLKKTPEKWGKIRKSYKFRAWFATHNLMDIRVAQLIIFLLSHT